jgi:hypothetical protein
MIDPAAGTVKTVITLFAGKREGWGKAAAVRRGFWLA